MTHKTRESIDEQQKQMQSKTITVEDLRKAIVDVLDTSKNWKIEEKKVDSLINKFEKEVCIERDSIWMDSIAYCDILTNENIAEIKRAVSWHDKSNQNKDK